jgi:hypothetical protein
MISREIPLVVIFNNMSKSYECFKTPEKFTTFVKQRGIVPKEVIHIENFNLQAFKARYNTAYQAVLPANLHEILSSKDPKFIASELKKNRELQCQTLPDHLATVRKRIDEQRSGIKSEESIPACKVEICNIKEPEAASCTRSECTEQGVAFVNNNASMAAFDLKLSQCQVSAKQNLATCTSNRASEAELTKQRNVEYAASIEKLKEEEIEAMAKLSTCISV